MDLLNISDKRKTIAIFYWDVGLGGVQRKILDICGELKKSKGKIKVKLLLNFDNKQDLVNAVFLEKIKKLGIEVCYAPSWKWRRFNFPYTLYAIYYVWRVRPDVILSFLHRHGVISALTKILFLGRKIKVIIGQDIALSEVFSENFKSNKWERIYWTLLVKLFYPFSDLIIVPAAHIKNDLVNSFGVKSEKIVLIHNWVSILRKDTKQYPIKYKYDLIFVGRLSAQKRPELLMKIFKTISQNMKRKVTMCVLGYGELFERTRNLSKRLRVDKNIDFVGSVDDVSSYLKSSKIFVLTSTYEGEPISVLEAMSFGLPVVAMNYVGAKELIRNGEEGYVCKSREDFARKITKLLKDQRLRTYLGKNSKVKCGKLNSQKNLSDFVNSLLS